MTLSVAFRHRFPGLELEVAFDAPGGLTALFGPSGCGKSTTTSVIAGLMRPQSGYVRLNGRTLLDDGIELPPQARRIGMVFQDARLFPHMTVEANLRYPARWRRGAGRDFDRITRMLALEPLLKRYPRSLSGGEKQRTSIGRALLSDPDLLVMDEPLASLDDARKAEIMPWLERLRDEVQLPILYVTHSVAEIVRLATTVVMMREGRVRHAGALGDILADPGWAAELGPREAGALIRARVDTIEPDGMVRVMTGAGPMLLSAGSARPGQLLRLRVLAHEVILSRTAPSGLSALNVLPTTVTALSNGLVQLRLGDERMLAQVTPRSMEMLDLQQGTPCFAIIKSVSILPSPGKIEPLSFA